MDCPNCGTRDDETRRFCRKCGTDFRMVQVQEGSAPKNVNAGSLSRASSKDPDELTGNGIGAVIMGDGFLIVAAILSTTHTTISSLLWLLLVLPAFGFFGKGFADVLLARQIRRRLKQNELDSVSEISSPPGRGLIGEVAMRFSSGELVSAPSVTERTTRQLKS